jgi:glycerate dehydrogenase
MSTPRIVVLDGEKFSDLSWEPLRALGTLTVHERSKAEEVPARAAGADIILTNKSPIGAATLGALPQLRYIGVLATGHNVVDGAAARTRGIPVTNVPEYGTLTVAQHVFALLLELTQQTGAYAAGVKHGRWTQGKADWCYWDKPLVELAGLQLGLIGSGRIGQAVARIAEAFGMRVVFAQRPKGPASSGKLPLEQVLRTSDVISLHCPLTPDTKDLIRAETLGWMKPNAFLVNTSRGGLICDQDLAAALNQGRIAGAALDVLSVEPPPADNPLLKAENCLITPHIAWAATPARARLLEVAVANVKSFLAGNPQHVVNPAP